MQVRSAWCRSWMKHFNGCESRKVTGYKHFKTAMTLYSALSQYAIFWCSCNRNGERVRGLFSLCNLNHASCKPASWPANQWFDLQAKVIFTNTWHLVSTNSGCWPWIEVKIKDNKRWQRTRVFKCPGFTSLKTTVNILK